jgi:hypothetical protein
MVNSPWTIANHVKTMVYGPSSIDLIQQPKLYRMLNGF